MQKRKEMVYNKMETAQSEMKKHCVIYVRVSSEKQIDGYSLDSQEDLCSKRAEQLGFETIAVYREEGVSAKTTKRPVLQEMLSFCLNKKNNISAILVYSLSRINRDTANHLALKSLLARSGVELISLTEPTDNTPTGTFIETIFAAWAQMDNETRAQNVANSLKRRFFEGYITTKPPLGYLMIKVNGKSMALKDQDSFGIMQDMWKKVGFEGWTLAKVANELNSRSIKLKSDKRFSKFTPKSISRLFSNKFYMGILKSVKYGETVGKHEPMIDDILFYRVRDVMTCRKPKSSHYNTLREDFKLRKLLRCKDCNRPMASSWSTGRSKKYPFYFCPVRCNPKSYNRDKVEEKFIKLLQSITYDKDWLVWYTEYIKEKYHTQYDESIRTRKLIEHDIEELQAAKKIARQKNVKGVYTDDEYLEMKKEYDAEIIVKEGLLAEKRMMEIDIDTILEFVVFYLSNLDRAWLDASPEGRVDIGGSIFPDGVVFDENEFRTATLGHGYEAAKELEKSPMSLGEPRVQNFEPLLIAYHEMYRNLKQYIPAFQKGPQV